MIPLDTTFTSPTAGFSVHPISRQTDSAGGVSITVQLDFVPFGAPSTTSRTVRAVDVK
jgi:hypothetical protein